MNITLVLPDSAKLPYWFDKYKILKRTPVAPAPPLGLLSVAAFLEHEGHAVQVIDNYLERFDCDKLVKRILSTYPEVVGFHATSISFPEVRKYLDLLKNEDKNIVTVIGGPLASIYPEDVAGNPKVDYVVRNEGEITFSKLVKNLLIKDDVKKIKGLSYKKENTIIHNENRPLIKNLDILPFPALHLIDISRYPRREMFFDAHPVDIISSSRGCPFNCHFCSSCRYMFYRSYRFRSAKNVVDEIELLTETYGTKGLFFREDLFTVDKARLFDLCDEIKRRNIEIPWICESRVDTISKEKLKKMKSAGCKAIWFGCESGSQRILDYINKEVTVPQIEDAFRMCKEENIITGAAFVLGFPTETIEDTKKTMQLAKKIRSDFTWGRIYIASPRSPIYDEVIKNKYYRPQYEFEGIVAVETTEYSLEEKVKYYKKMNTEFFKITMKNLFLSFVPKNKPTFETIKNIINIGKYMISGK